MENTKNTYMKDTIIVFVSLAFAKWFGMENTVVE